jgi:hypothetical protein
MPDDLLGQTREQAERSEPAVRAAALLRIARVETASDRQQARNTFEQALMAIKQLTGVEGDFLVSQARLVAAAVAPDLVLNISSFDRLPRRFTSEHLGRIMLEHHNEEAAVDYVTHYDEPSSFPFGVVSALMRSPADDQRRLLLLRSAVEAWRAAPQERPVRSFQFISLFQSQWKLLTLEEAGAVAREIVRTTLEQADRPITATYDPEGTTRITSAREHTLFQIFHIVRHVDEKLAGSLLAAHEQLAVAVRRFPNGMESVVQEAEARRSETRRLGTGGGFGMAGSPRDFSYFHALMQASQDGDFGPAIQQAIEKYSEDTAPGRPNRAPKEFWPSTSRFRSILYKAGKTIGESAAVYLEPIPDADLRLFAQIELAAALAGLPEMQGVQREDRRNPDGPRRQVPHARPADLKTTPVPGDTALDAEIRCPECQWSPNAEARWSCRCGHLWNTFHTRGVCPDCRHQWTLTACLRCGKTSPHAEWYSKE